MSARSGPTPLDVLRRAVAARAEATSVSAVARAVGLTPRGLRLFMEGTTPYAATRRKLEVWYVRDVAQRAAELDANTATAALSVLSQDIPPSHRGRLVREVVRLWGDAYDAAGVPRPTWLADLPARYGEEQGQS